MANATNSPALPETLPPDIQAMSFEQALAELDTIVQKLESGRVALEDSIAIYERGTHLKRHCETKLKAASEKIETITLGPNGQISTQPTKID